jgi:hypothetical protein
LWGLVREGAVTDLQLTLFEQDDANLTVTER